jgi:hypothetical protein
MLMLMLMQMPNCVSEKNSARLLTGLEEIKRWQ